MVHNVECNGFKLTDMKEELRNKIKEILKDEEFLGHVNGWSTQMLDENDVDNVTDRIVNLLPLHIVSDCVFSNMDDDGFTLSIHKTEEGAKKDRDKRKEKGEDVESYQVRLFE